MSEVLKALEHMAQHGGNWYSNTLQAFHNGEAVGQWFLALQREESEEGHCITDIEIQNFINEYKQLKASNQAYQEVQKELPYGKN